MGPSASRDPRCSLPDGWKDRFLAAYREQGNQLRACKVAEVSRSAVWLNRQSDPEFDAAVEQVKADLVERLEDAAITRATEGTLEPVFYEGAECGEKLRHHDGLAIFLLKQRRPKTYNIAPGRDAIEETTAAGERAFEMAVGIEAALAEIHRRNGLAQVSEAPPDAKPADE